jgi:hypothetical protein
LDEFAFWLNLSDVYWQHQGGESYEAMARAEHGQRARRQTGLLVRQIEYHLQKLKLRGLCPICTFSFDGKCHSFPCIRFGVNSSHGFCSDFVMGKHRRLLEK